MGSKIDHEGNTIAEWSETRDKIGKKRLETA